MLLDALRRELEEAGPKRLEARRARGQEAVVRQALVEDHPREPVEYGHVRARPRAQVDVGVGREVDATGIDHHEPGAGDRPLDDPGPDDGMRLGRVGPRDQDAAGAVEVLQRIRPPGQAEARAQAGGGRRVADPRAVVNVVAPEADAHELLDEVVLLVRRPGGRDHADRGGSVRRRDPPHPPGRRGQRLVPGRRAKAACPPHERDRQAVVRGGEAVREAPLHAGVAPVHRPRAARGHRGDATAADVDVEGAADAAEAAGRGRDGLDRRGVEEPRLVQRPGRAAVGAGAAGDAGRVDPALPRAGRDVGLEPAPLHGQGEGALQLVAEPHAEAAGDAEVAVELDVGVRVVAAAVVAGPGERLAIDAQGSARGGQAAAGVGRLEGPRGQLRDQQLEHAAGGRPRDRVVGRDRRALDRGRRRTRRPGRARPRPRPGRPGSCPRRRRARRGRGSAPRRPAARMAS